jgi:hypothetical protein
MSETYPYENLDAKRFQRLVQILLTTEYPHVESFPLSGPDGGRDAVEVVQQGTRLTDALIFQIKFREQQPLGVPTTSDLYSWLTGQLKEEVDKLISLKERGATKYMVISNVKATAGLGVGLRDKMNEWTEKNLPLPTTFWWRDDLDTRLPKHYDLILKFGLFTGPEAVRAVLEARFEGRTDISTPIQRSNTPSSILALMSYLAEQYRLESKLRFEQADLPGSPLLDLFVDVPVAVTSFTPRKEFSSWLLRAIKDGVIQPPDLDNERARRSRFLTSGIFRRRPSKDPVSGGADLMLAQEMPKSGFRIVLEGAPGQGKSTLGQYVCQAHRIRLLNKSDDLSKLPMHHAESPVRLPIRVEFRHLAIWFSGTNPWSSESVSGNLAPHYWAQSLESFIAAHVRHASGAMTFVPDDIVSILIGTPSFIFLDGLDEVADIPLREEIVEAVEASINRLGSLGADMQVLITSRPAIFLKAPGFSPKGFEYLRLETLTKRLIANYTRSWLKIREMPDEQGKEIIQVLETSLEQTHVAQLSRNPMQLAILLWLISIKGRSLPNQRTSLYEQYLTAFLDREAKNNVTVRTHRARLLEIHGFLGWVLHSRAESPDPKYAGGDITEADLRTLLHSYLEHEERATDLVDELFKGAERVFVLVSRIEGKFEFEVQPLREFFAARYLYKTAPHSTPGAPARGTRPDRLEQLIRNPYWLNVARFFCGWYDKGELADLSRRLRDLCEDPDYKLLGYPRYLIAYILQDCTTADSQRDTRELATAMLDTLGLRLAVSPHSDLHNSFGTATNTNLLPVDCGLSQLVECLRNAITDAGPDERRKNLARVIRMNDAPTERARWWLNRWNSDDGDRASWLLRGVEMDAVSHLSLEDALAVFDPATTARLDWIRCVEAGRFDVGFHDPARLELFVRALGDGFAPLPFSSIRRDIGRLAHYGHIFQDSRLNRGRETYTLSPDHYDGPDPNIPDSMLNAIYPLDRLLRIAASPSGSNPRSFYSHMANIIDTAYDIFGDSWLCWKIALIVATVSACPTGRAAGFFDASAKFWERTRLAKLSSGDVAFWSDFTFQSFTGHGVRLAAYSAAFSWADPEILINILPNLARDWEGLEQFDVRVIARLMQTLIGFSGIGRNAPRPISKEIIGRLPDLPASMLCMLYFRKEEGADSVLMRRIAKMCSEETQFEDMPHGSLVASMLMSYSIKSWYRQSWRSRLDDISRYYRGTVHGSLAESHPTGGYDDYSLAVRTEISREILSRPADYPDLLIASADGQASDTVSRKLRPLREIAIEEDWFAGLPA